MSKIKDRSALDKIIRARTNLLVNNGFFGFLAMQLRLVECVDDPQIKTAAVDGKSMYYNPAFVHQLDERETEFLVAHEVMHCCFQHFSRRGSRDPNAWNIAGDFSINLDLQEAGFKLIHNRPINGKNFKCCIDPKYKGWTTEDIYESFPKVNVNIVGGAGDGSGGMEGCDPGGCGGVIDAPGTAGEKESTSHNWETAVRTAIAVATANNAGQIPGSLKRLVDQLRKPKISWRDKTRNFIDQSMLKDISWARPSRRSVGAGVLMPGLVSDRIHQLVMIADTSGSVTQPMLTAFVSECAGALDEGTCDEMIVLYADTKVQHVDHFTMGDIVEVKDAKELGGGGTDFRDSFNWVKEHAPNASCVVYLTDLQVHEFGEDPGCPTMWAVYGPEAYFDQLAERAPFGMPIYVGNEAA